MLCAILQDFFAGSLDFRALPTREPFWHQKEPFFGNFAPPDRCFLEKHGEKFSVFGENVLCGKILTENFLQGGKVGQVVENSVEIAENLADTRGKCRAFCKRPVENFGENLVKSFLRKRSNSAFCTKGTKRTSKGGGERDVRFSFSGPYASFLPRSRKSRGDGREKNIRRAQRRQDRRGSGRAFLFRRAALRLR